MQFFRVCGVLLILCAGALLFPVSLWAGESTDARIILDTSGFWRLHYALKPPVVKDGENLRELPTLSGSTPPPPEDWTHADFDDSGWTRLAGAPFPAVRGFRSPLEMIDAGFTDTDFSSPALALICVRGKFNVTNPTAVRKLSLSASFRGGIVACVNGKEVARAYLPKGLEVKPDTLAEDYPLEAYVKADGSLLSSGYDDRDPQKAENHRRGQLRVRRISDVAIPPHVLRKGVNVLTLEVHRAPYDKVFFEKTHVHGYVLATLMWSSCGLETLRLTGEGTGGVPNATRPKGFQIWNSPPLIGDFDLDYGDPNEPLRPVRIIGTRGGNFSGKVVVGSDRPIKGLKARVTDFTAANGKGQIPASAVHVRYALPSGWEAVPIGRYPAQPDFFDALSDKALVEVPVYVKKKVEGPWIRPGQPDFVFGAVQPVWVTVEVPGDAETGEYRAKLTVTAEGVKPVEAPVELDVCGWKLPPPSDFRTVVDLVQSPESVALEYHVEPYGNQHFKLLEKSLERLGYVGNWTLYIPLICQTNQSNEESMIRWIKKPGGGYRHDFTVFERYLDLAEKHMGRPKIICLYIWDLFLGGRGGYADGGGGFGTRVLEGEGPPVTLLDPATGKTSTVQLPRLGARESRDLWKDVAEGIRQRLEKRGLEKTMMLGIGCDGCPDAETISMLGELFPGVPWMRHGHWYWKDMGPSKTKIGYQANLWTGKFLEDPVHGKFSCYGWKRPENVCSLFRTAAPHCPLVMCRLFPEFNIQGTQHGIGRIGLDFWPVLEGAKGVKKAILGRYPKNSWKNLDLMVKAFVPPGPDGAYASVRLEMMREGLQEDEARIFLEDALTDEGLRGRLGEELTKRCQSVLDERVRSLLPNLENQVKAGFLGPSLWGWPTGFEHEDVGYQYDGRRAAVFYLWYLGSSWQERSHKLYSAAAAVAEALVN